MNIGIDSGVIEQLAQTSENTDHYLLQLTREGHTVVVVVEGGEHKDLDLYVSKHPRKNDSTAKICLSFPDRVGTWWEIYYHIRYEL